MSDNERLAVLEQRVKHIEEQMAKQQLRSMRCMPS